MGVIPVKLTHINASIACDYLRLNPPLLNHVRRHKTLIKSGPLNGVTLDSIFLPFVSADQNRITAAIKDAKWKLSRDQEGGKRLANELLSTTKKPLEFIKHIFGSGHTEYQELADEVAKTTMQCAIAFTNKTGDWDASLRLLGLIASLACSQKLKAEIAENKKIVEKNSGSSDVNEAIRITNSAVESVNRLIERANKNEISREELITSLATPLQDMLRAQELAPGEKHIEDQIASLKKVALSLVSSMVSPRGPSYSHPTYSCPSAWTGLKNKLVSFFQFSWFWIILFWLGYYFVEWIWNKWF